MPFSLDRADADCVLRGCVYGVTVDFVGLVLPPHREVELRNADVSVSNVATHTHERMRLLKMQTRDMVRLAVREIVRRR
jgi:hypothetical protein